MERRFKSYLRTFRRSRGLTQKELAFLIGAESSTTVSRLEQLKRPPNLTAAFACRVIFDTCAIDIFPGLFSEIHEAVQARATELYEELQGDPSAGTRVKLDFLESILARGNRTANADV
ncbi:MAG: helix-turn-helix transcriptional regulator [Steroidobacteraceae bacterium]